MIKSAGLEQTSVSDPVHGKPIKISTTLRLLYRKIYNDPNWRDFTKMRNETLNEIIAQDFASSSGKIMHYFALGKINDQQRDLGEIRNMMIDGRGIARFYVSAIRDDSVDVISIQSRWIKTKFRSKEDMLKRLQRLSQSGRKQLDFDFRGGH